MRDFHASDLPEVNRWFQAHGRAGLGYDHVPQTGRIEPGVAAGFLYVTDSTVTLLDGYVTNPAASATERNRALDAITFGLIDAAREMGSTHVVAICSEEATAQRALKFGFRSQGTATVLARSL